MKHLLAATLILSLLNAGCSPAWAQTVEVPDIPPTIEEGGPDISALATSAPIGTELAMLYHVPTDATAEVTPARNTTLPLAITAGTGSDTRLSIDMSAARNQVEQDGWGWKTWTVIGVSVVALSVAAVLIVQSTQGGGDSSGDDSSTTITIPGNGNTINVNSPNYGHPATTGGDL